MAVCDLQAEYLALQSERPPLLREPESASSLKGHPMKQLIMISILVAFGSHRSVGAQTDAGPETAYELVSTSLTVNEPVIVKLTVTNRLPIVVTTYRSFSYKLTRPDGRPPNGHHPSHRTTLVRTRLLPLRAFETLVPPAVEQDVLLRRAGPLRAERDKRGRDEGPREPTCPIIA